MPGPDSVLPSAPNDTPTLLERARGGDAGARDQFVALLYAELRRLAPFAPHVCRGSDTGG